MLKLYGKFLFTNFDVKIGEICILTLALKSDFL
jgi:hypothetical protein